MQRHLTEIKEYADQLRKEKHVVFLKPAVK